MTVEEFLKYMRYELNYSVHTVLSYKNDLNQFADYLTGGGTEPLVLEDVTQSDVRSWMLHRSSQGDTPRTIRRKVQAVRALYKAMLRRGEVSENPAADVEMAKLSKRLPNYVRGESMDELIGGEYDETDFRQVRDRLMVMMFYVTGIRRAELIGLKDADVDVSAMEMKVRGKRNKDRIVPFGDELKSDIECYRKLRSQQVGSVEYFFVRENGEQLYATLVYRTVHEKLKQVGGCSKYSPHVLRHTFASAMLNGGAQLNSVKELLGHESLAATQVYTHITFRELKDNYQLAHPRALKKEDNMEVKIKAIHFDASAKLESFINRKAEKLARRNEEIDKVEVTLKVVKPESAMNKEVGIKIVIPQVGEIFASKVADTFEEAIDVAIDALEHQLDKTKKSK